jgi:hypothetical protein
VQKVLDLVRIKRINRKMTDTTSFCGGGDKKGALNTAPQAELKVQEDILYIVVDTTFYFSQPEYQ